MTIANDIISYRTPNIDQYLAEGVLLEDFDEYGFTPLIETAITRQPKTAKLLLEKGAKIDTPDSTGRTALFWAVDNDDLELAQLLLKNRANPNSYTRAGMPLLVNPVLRGQANLKQLLYQFGAKVDFALDYIYAKLIGHRYELKGMVDIVNHQDEFVEINYEGFILEFSVALIKQALQRFTTSFSTRQYRAKFSLIRPLIDALGLADKLLYLQRQSPLIKLDLVQLQQCLLAPMLVLPAASEGHAIGFIRYNNYLAKIDRGEQALREGSVNIYKITRPENFDVAFLRDFLFQKQPQSFFHQDVNQRLGLQLITQMAVPRQIVGNCSWANMQALFPVAYVFMTEQITNTEVHREALDLFNVWVEWDKDRALDECIQRFEGAGRLRQATYATIIGAVLFQSCNADNPKHLERAEKILKILTKPDFEYVLQSYYSVYCTQSLTRLGNNLLKILELVGINSGLDVHPIATGLKKRT